VASPLLINIIEMTRRAGTLKDIEITIPVSTFDFSDKRLDDATEIDIALQLESINGGIIVQGTVTGKSQLLCGRCLRDIDYANVASIDEMYQRVPDNPDAYPIVGESLDLQPMVREPAGYAIMQGGLPWPLPTMRRRFAECSVRLSGPKI